MADLFGISEDDLAILRGLIDREKRTVRPQRAARSEQALSSAPEVYIAKIPSAGIPARVGAVPSYADCGIYRLSNDDTTPTITPVGGLDRRVYNLLSEEVSGDTYAPVWRDKFGSWVVGAPTTAGDAGTGGGSTVTIEELDGSPTGTLETLRLNQDDGFQLVNVSGNIWRVNILDANGIAQAGIVSVGVQDIGGSKTFLGVGHFTATSGGLNPAVDSTGQVHAKSTAGGGFMNHFRAGNQADSYTYFFDNNGTAGGANNYGGISHSEVITGSTFAASARLSVSGLVLCQDDGYTASASYPLLGFQREDGTQAFGLNSSQAIVTGAAIFPTSVVSGVIISATTLSDPGGFRLPGWDDVSNAVEWYELGTGLSVTGNTIEATGGSYTDEEAQDAVGAMVADTDTVNVTYTDATPELKWDVRYQMSITADSSGIKLVGDHASPGDMYFYCTGPSGGGGKGWYTGANGMDALGNTFLGGLCTTVGSGSATGDWVKLDSVTASGSATVNLTSLGGSTYRVLCIVLDHVAPANNSVDLYCRTSTNGGSSYDSGASDYDWTVFVINDAAGSGASSDQFDSEMQITNLSLGNGTNRSSSGYVWIFNPDAAKYAHLTWNLLTVNDSTPNMSIFQAFGSGMRYSAANVDAIRFYMSAGNIASGTFTLYGLKA